MASSDISESYTEDSILPENIYLYVSTLKICFNFNIYR